MAKKMTHYLAYGSNLHIDQMRRRCPDAKPLGSIIVNDGLLTFRGVADVVSAKGGKVPCGLWKISRADEAALDAYEGVSCGLYVKRYVEITDAKGVHYDALIYMMRDKGIAPPSEYYLDVIAKGYDDFGLDKAYLSEAVERSWRRKDMSPLLRRRWEAKGKPRAARPYPDAELDVSPEPKMKEIARRFSVA